VRVHEKTRLRGKAQAGFLFCVLQPDDAGFKRNA
jgi:hypothetical protein